MTLPQSYFCWIVNVVLYFLSVEVQCVLDCKDVAKWQFWICWYVYGFRNILFLELEDFSFCLLRSVFFFFFPFFPFFFSSSSSSSVSLSLSVCVSLYIFILYIPISQYRNTFAGVEKGLIFFSTTQYFAFPLFKKFQYNYNTVLY